MKRMNISQISTFFANGCYPIEFLLYFPQHINTKKLRHALKKISRMFWPVFGSYVEGSISEQPYVEKEFYDERFVDEAFDSTKTREELYYAFSDFLPTLKGSRLFFLKVLHYTNGTVLLIKMKHLVGDGYSFFYLLSVLAAITKRSNIPILPAVIKALSKPKFYCKLHGNFRFTGEPPEAQANDGKDFTIKALEIEQSVIKSLAKQATEKAGKRISRNDILCAYMLKLIVKNKSQGSTEKITLVMPVDMRRAVPELGLRYFGNALIFYRLSFNRKEIGEKEVEELAKNIRENFPERNRQEYVDYLKTIECWIKTGAMRKLILYDSETEFLVTNLSRMPVAKLDFGSGPPTVVVPLTRGKSGAAILTKDDKYLLQVG